MSRWYNIVQWLWGDAPTARDDDGKIDGAKLCQRFSIPCDIFYSYGDIPIAIERAANF